MNTVPLGSLITPARSVRAGEGAYPVLSITMHEGLVFQQERFKKTIAGKDLSSYKVVNRGQLVVGFPIDEAVLDFQEITDAGIVSPAYGVWDVVDPEAVNSSYLGKYLRSPQAISYYKLRLRGTTARRRSLTKDAFEALPVPLPPSSEQQRIAEILDNSLQLSEQIAIKITLLDEAEKSSYLSMFGAEPATTPTQELAAAHKGSMRTGPFGSQLKHEEFVDEGVAVLGLDNVVSNRFQWAEPRHITAEKYEQLKRYTVYSGDVLISIMGTTGRCVIVPENIPTTINTKHICAITTDHARMFPEFLRASFLWHPEVRQALRQQTKGAIMAGLNMGIIKKLALPVPDISRQQEWVSISKEFDTLREKILKQQSLAEELQNSFSTRAFTGQL